MGLAHVGQGRGVIPVQFWGPARQGGNTPPKNPARNRIFHLQNRFFSYQNSFPRIPTPSENDSEGGSSVRANFQAWGWLGDSSSSIFGFYGGSHPPSNVSFSKEILWFWLIPGSKIDDASMGGIGGGYPP